MNKYIDKNLKLTEHFSLSEMCTTSVQTADHNYPSQEVITNLKRLAKWLEMLRDEWNKRYGEGNDPIYINSGYRSPAVNKAVGGVATSNHLTGCAADIRCTGLEQAFVYAYHLLMISRDWKEDFDELLVEQSSRSTWIHFAVRASGNRRKVAFKRV